MRKRILTIFLALTVLCGTVGTMASMNAAAGTEPGWTGASSGSVGFRRTADAVQAGSLIAGMIPAKGVTDALFGDPTNGTASQLTDGSLTDKSGSLQNVQYTVGLGGYPDGRYGTAISAATAVRFTFDLGSVSTVTHVLVGAGTNNRLWNGVLVYTGTNLATLYSTDNLWVQMTDADAPDPASLHNEYKGGADAQARYVGFAFYDTRLSSGHNGCLRLSELAVYGTSSPVVPDWSAAVDGAVGQRLNTFGDRLAAGNLLAGRTPTNGITGVAWAPSTGTLAQLTDGVIKENGTEQTVYFNGGVAAASKGNVCFTFDLGGAFDLNYFLVGSASSRYIRNVTIYAGNTPESLYSDGNLVVSCTGVSGSYNYYKGEKVTAVRYVGFAFCENDTGWWGGALVRFSELAVYGTAAVSPVLQLNSVNMGKLPASNLLKNAYLTKGRLEQNSSLAAVTDGVIAGVNEAETVNNKTVFLTEGVACRDDGTTRWNNGAGWAEISFRLSAAAEIQSFLIAGSACDSVAGNNRHVVYYEFYAAETQETLFDGTSRVYTFDNSAELGICQLVTLEAPVQAKYVGFRAVGGAQGMARIGELGVYGKETGAPDGYLTYTPFSTAEQMAVLVNGQENRIKGTAVGGKTTDYLPLSGVVLESGKEAFLSDGEIRWTAADVDNKVAYSNASGESNPVYDLRGTMRFSGLLIANNGTDASIYRIRQVDIYVSDEEDQLFTKESHVGTVNLQASDAVGAYIPLDVQGRYIGLAIPGDTNYKVVRLNELGVYGTYTDPSSIRPLPTNLVRGSLPVDSLQVDARGIDNCTALDAQGLAGTGNTGALTGRINATAQEDLANLNDGDPSTRAAHVLTTPDGADGSVLNYNTPWLVFVYYLGGEASVESLSLYSSNEYNYQISGVQYYASYRYDDLFRNESLLYTSGGERYVADEYEESGYLPDATVETSEKNPVRYELTAGQSAETYRYVAVVITRPYSLYSRSSGYTQRLAGYGIARISEIVVNGLVTKEEEPLKSSFLLNSSVGSITYTIKPYNPDDTAFFSSIGEVQLTEETLPEGVSRNIENNWLTVDGTTAFHFRVLDKSGNLIPADGEDSATALCDRLIQIRFPAAGDHTQTMAYLRDGALTRLYNAYNKKNGYIEAGALNYPVFTRNVINYADKATLNDTDLTLVYLRYNSLDTIRKLNGRTGVPTLAELGGGEVAGVSVADKAPWLRILWLLPVLPVAVTGAVLVKKRMSLRRCRH